MRDEADVGAVDAHAEGVGGDHNRILRLHEARLDAAPFRRFESRVVEKRLRLAERRPRSTELRIDAFRVLARRDVDNARTVGLHEREDMRELLLVRAAGTDRQVEVEA